MKNRFFTRAHFYSENENGLTNPQQVLQTPEKPWYRVNYLYDIKKNCYRKKRLKFLTVNGI